MLFQEFLLDPNLKLEEIGTAKRLCEAYKLHVNDGSKTSKDGFYQYLELGVICLCLRDGGIDLVESFLKATLDNLLGNLTAITDALEKAKIPSTVYAFYLQLFEKKRGFSFSNVIPWNVTEQDKTLGYGGVSDKKCFETQSTSDGLVAKKYSGELAVLRTAFPFSSLGPRCFENNGNLVLFKAPNSLKTLSPNCFSSCSKLSAVFLPDQVGSIPESCFEGDEHLRLLATESSLDPSFGLIGSKAFAETSIKPSFEKTSFIGSEAFRDDKSLEHLVIGNALIKAEEGVFSGCDSIKSIEILFDSPREFDALKMLIGGQKNLAHCFPKLEKITLKNANVSGLTFENEATLLSEVSIEAQHLLLPEKAFSNAKELKNVSLIAPDIVLSTNLFANCSALKNLQISLRMPFDSIPDGCFLNCKNLDVTPLAKYATTIGVSALQGTDLSHFDFSPKFVSVGSHAFADCQHLAKISNLDLSSAKFLGDDCFPGFEFIDRLTVSTQTDLSGKNFADLFEDVSMLNVGELTVIGTLSDPKMLSRIRAKTIHLVDPGAIPERAFENKDFLEAVIISGVFSSVGPYAFSNCGDLQKIEYQGETAHSGIRVESHAFALCRKLASNSLLSLSSYIGTSAFLENPITSAFFRDDAEFEKGALARLFLLKKLDLPKLDAPLFSDLFDDSDNQGKESAAPKKSNLVPVIPVGLSFLRIRSGSIKEAAFRGLATSQLSEIDLGEVTEVKSFAFAECPRLTKLSFGKSLSVIDSTVFYGCSCLSSVQIASDNSKIKIENGMIVSFDGTKLLALLPNAQIDLSGNLTIHSFGRFSVAFYQAPIDPKTGLSTLFIPSNVSLDSKAFVACSSQILHIGKNVSACKDSLYGLRDVSSVELEDYSDALADEMISFKENDIRSISIGHLSTSFALDRIFSKNNRGKNDFDLLVDSGSAPQEFFSERYLKKCVLNQGVSIKFNAFVHCSFEELILKGCVLDKRCFDRCSATVLDVDVALNVSVALLGFSSIKQLNISGNGLSSGLLKGIVAETIALVDAVSLEPECFGSVKVNRIVLPKTLRRFDGSCFKNCQIGLIEVEAGNPVISVAEGCVINGDQLVVATPLAVKNGFFELKSASKIRRIGKLAFIAAPGLSHLNLGNLPVHVEAESFQGCGSIATLLISDDETIPTISRIFKDSVSCLKKITFNGPIIKKSFFAGLNHLETLVFNQKIRAVGDRAFSGDERLAPSLELPDALYIGDFAFEGCKSLAEVSIGKAAESIGRGIFAGCSSLTRVTLPAIGKYECLGEVTPQHFGQFFSDRNPDDFNEFYAICLEKMSAPSFFLPKTLERVTLIGLPKLDPGFFEEVACDCVCDFDAPLVIVPARAFECVRSVTGLDFSKIVSLGEAAFKGTILAKNVTENLRLSQCREIGPSAFESCGSFSRVAFSSHLEKIDASAFAHDTIGKIDFAGNENYCFEDGAFIDKETGRIFFLAAEQKSSSLSSRFIRVISDSQFLGDTDLKEIALPDLEEIGDDAFYGCANLTKIELPSCLTKIGNRAFLSPCNLESLVFPDSLISIGLSSFQNIKVNHLSISDPKIFGQNDFLSIFGGVGGAKNIEVRRGDIPENFFKGAEAASIRLLDNVNQVSPGAFDNAKLDSLQIAETCHVVPTSLSGCLSLSKLSVPSFCWEHGLFASSLQELFVSKGEFPDGALFDFSSLRKLELGPQVTALGRIVFSHCGLTSLRVPKGLEKIADACFFDSSLLDVTVEEGNPVFFVEDGVLRTRGKAICCFNRGLQNYAAKAHEVIVSRAFENLPLLESLDLSAEGISLESNCFVDLPALKKIILPDERYLLKDVCPSLCSNEFELDYLGGAITEATLEGIRNLVRFVGTENLKSIGERAFRGTSLRSISGLEGVERIGSQAFPPTLEEAVGFRKLVEIQDEAFSQSRIENLDFSHCCLSVIGTGAFSKCALLKKILLPNTLKAIQSRAFSSCTALSSIELPRSVEEVGEGIFHGCARKLNVTIHAPETETRWDKHWARRTIFNYKIVHKL
jgi:hypothetical protein